MSTMQNNEDPNWVTTYNEHTNSFTRVDKDGCSWTWRARPRPTKPVLVAKNGLTIQKLQEAGNSVRVKHLRWAMYWPHYDKRRYLGRALVVPSTFRGDPSYKFLPKGGYTHVVIKDKAGNYVCVSSECAEDDTFCYAAGVAAALDRLDAAHIGMLLA